MTELMSEAEIRQQFARSAAILSPAQDAVILDMWGPNAYSPSDREELKSAYFHMFRYWTHDERDPLDVDHFKAFLGGFSVGRRLA
jgi:hypothetical protein